ncbi:MAG: tetratricopeptide repeat protein [Bacteroidales bacterium]|jgi:tetratricopeptide (TPR) repeat protein
MKRFIPFALLIFLITGNNLFPQAKVENKMKFYDAESWMLFEDYKEALPEYLELLKSYPNNYNLKYRIGQCYLNITGEKDKAIGYLEDAVKHINPDYKDGKFKETDAPYDAYYYLANAYRINNQLDKAIETYKIFKKDLNPKVYDSTIVSQQIQSCLNAKDLMSMPLFVREKNLGDRINGRDADFNPVVSDDEKIIVFSRSEAFYDAILYSTKNPDGTWSEPVNMNEIFQVDKDLYPTSISSDGKTLYLYSSADYDGIIYSSTFKDGKWGPLVKLNNNINTKYWESHATISHDNKKLYFTSNRKGTYGGLDIYVSQRDSTGDWGPAVNLGPVINTPYNEETPFLSKDDKTLFFSSRGHFNMGGYDIFYSTLLPNGEWSVPLNVGYPLNSTDDDVFFKPIKEGYEGYIAKDEPEGYGKEDIYKVEIFSDQHPRKFLVRGFVKVEDLIFDFNDSVKISAMNIKNPNQTIVVYSNPKTGEYEFQLPQGNYEVSYESQSAEKIKKNINLPLTNPSDSFVMPGTILPKTDFVADLTVESSKNISVTKGDTIAFPLKVEPKSMLRIEHWAGDSLISSHEYRITDSVFNYKMVPYPGDNRVSFKLTDRFNNSTTTDVFIKREKGVTSTPVVRPEYARIIAQKQVASFVEMFKNRADDKLRKIISGMNFRDQQFGKIDDVVSYIKDVAAKSSISPEDIDKLALKVAVMDNVLTQSAVDLMAKYAEGDMKKMLEDVDIYKQDLRTWTDLQQYILEKSGGRFTAENLNSLAYDILTGTEPAIAIIREKILAYSDNSGFGTILKQSVSTNDQKKIKKAGLWLQSFYNESLKRNIKDYQLADMVAVISSQPGTSPDKYANDLTAHSEEPLSSWIKSLNLKKSNIKTPEDLVLFILRNKEKGNVKDEIMFSGLANLIASANIPADTIKSQMIELRHHNMWYLWLLAGAGLIFIIFLLRREKKKDKNKRQEE